LGALTWGAVELADNPGDVVIRWYDYAITTTVGVLLLLVAAVAVLWALIYHLWRWLRAGPGRFMAGRTARRRERGYQVLTQGLVAVAAGDTRAAQRLGRKAGQLIDNPLNLLVLAQAAQLGGDEAAARRHFKAMLDHPETEFLGLRGLIVQATKAGNWDAARAHARRAYALHPETEWVSAALFDLDVRAGDWRAAQNTLESATRNKLVTRDEAPRRRAVVLAERARAVRARGALGDAAALAREAHKLAPDLIAASAMAAELMADEGKARAAAKLVEAAWKLAPHPDLARAFAAIAPAETVLERTRRFEQLHQLNPESGEGHLAVAAAALDAELWGEARRHLEQAAASQPCQRVFRLLAMVEENAGGTPEAVRGWLLKAASAPPDAAWQCATCGAAAAEWSARCDTCGGFDSLAWKTPAAPAAVDHTPVLADQPTSKAMALDGPRSNPLGAVDAALGHD
ncbi:MAG: heme biosynthesis HemY N-terminal domain-containing protein, partial [Alphaproteobacteria bacterium]